MATKVSLTGIPETMLWTLYNRATEVRRPGGVLVDPDCVRIFEAIDYDFEHKFGKQTGIHAQRSRVFDTVVRAWLAEYPAGTVVELAAGLETQFQRVDNGTVSWLCVDLPEAVAVRERFLPATGRCRCLAADAMDPSWFDHIGSGPLLVSAQGLLMYFSEERVRQFIVALVDRFPGVDMVFDTISPLLSKKSMKGYDPTGNYETPAMPWGIKRNAIAPLLRRWHTGISDVQVRSFGPTHGILAAVTPLFVRIPVLRDFPPAVVHLKTSGAEPAVDQAASSVKRQDSGVERTS